MSEAKSALSTETICTDVTRFNALRHGVLSRYTVLPWENEQEFEALVSVLVAEHAPRGPTEEHLVEEVAGIIWRKRRLRLAESSAHRRGLESALKPHRHTANAALVHLGDAVQCEPIVEAIRASESDTENEFLDIQQDETVTREALKLLERNGNHAYEGALARLREDTQEWWACHLARDPNELEEDEEPASPDREGLRRFIEDEVIPWFEKNRKILTHRPLIKKQAFGDSLDVDKLEQLSRYEVHLDRKLERMLSMLLRLKEMRQGTIPN